MKAISLVRKIESMGGEAKIVSEQLKDYRGKAYTSHSVVGTLNGYDVHMIGLECSFFTIRRISQRGYYDPSADYNSGNWSFWNRVKDLEHYAEREVA